jgi:site-specific recombinase XerD
LSNGIPIESVGKMLGHKNIRMTQHYAKVIDKKVKEDMNMLKEKLAFQKIA